MQTTSHWWQLGRKASPDTEHGGGKRKWSWEWPLDYLLRSGSHSVLCVEFIVCLWNFKSLSPLKQSCSYYQKYKGTTITIQIKAIKGIYIMIYFIYVEWIGKKKKHSNTFSATFAQTFNPWSVAEKEGQIVNKLVLFEVVRFDHQVLLVSSGCFPKVVRTLVSTKTAVL